MRIEGGGSQGGDNLEILGRGQSVFFNSQRGTNFFCHGGGGPDSNTSLQGGLSPHKIIGQMTGWMTEPITRTANSADNRVDNQADN